MLVELLVRDFVLIDTLELRFEPGFNVLTGETGAGKSIVVGALGLVLGGRARPDLVRPGCDEAEIQARFDLTHSPGAKATLAAAGIEGDELVVRRIVQASGRSRAYLNGRLCTATELSALAPELADVSSQHESVALTDPGTHITYLDAFAKLDPLREELSRVVEQVAAKAKELTELREKERGREEREAFLRFQLAAIDELSPQPNEIDELEAERARLRHADRLGGATRGAADKLYDADGSLCDELGRLSAELIQASEIDAELRPLAEAVEAARAELVEAARALSRYADGIETDPARLSQVDDRLFRIGKLARQYGGNVEAVLAAKERLEEELDTLASAEERISIVESELNALLAVAAEQARKLSAERKREAERLGGLISRELSLLGMGRARVVVDVAQLEGSGGELEIDGARLSRDGIDRVELLIAPNPGAPPRPLRRIASGGELSRALLALKRVLAENGPAGLYVFDEVDTGVGGAVAEQIGHAIADVARHRQVLCITHLAQIAAFANAHYVVEKRSDAERAQTRVIRVGHKERVAEIARMISGAKITPGARKAAEEMLRGAGQMP